MAVHKHSRARGCPGEESYKKPKRQERVHDWNRIFAVYLYALRRVAAAACARVCAGVCLLALRLERCASAVSAVNVAQCFEF